MRKSNDDPMVTWLARRPRARSLTRVSDRVLFTLLGLACLSLAMAGVGALALAVNFLSHP